MNRRLVGLLAAFCLLSACNKTPEPVGKLEPLPRPAGTPAAAVEAPPESPPPARPDAAQVLLRWNLSAPTAYQLAMSASTAAPASAAPARKPPRVRKSSRKKGAAPVEGEASASAASQALTTFFLLRASTPSSGSLPFALLPEPPSGEIQRGTMSERGFVLGGLSGPVRNLAVMVLELPPEPVGPGSTWTLTTDLVSMDILPPGFRQKDSQQRSEVKLTALTPMAEGEQVATLEYELFESVSGQQGPARRGRRSHSHEHENTPLSVKKARGARSAKAAKADKDARPASELSAEVRVSGRGEFLVKAGRWRSWEARMSTRAEGLTLPGMPPGERVLRLTPVEPVPAALLQRLETK